MTPCKGRMFPLSQPESEAMNQYIKEELKRGFIYSSNSVAAARFFFVKKRRGDLHPCFDYWGLNITVKYNFPFPLIHHNALQPGQQSIDIPSIHEWLLPRHAGLLGHYHWELWAIKLALKKWRHWLEGASCPFTVLTDHKNLEYLHTAKHLNPCQACCALFFTHFNFTVTYCPGTQGGHTLLAWGEREWDKKINYYT